jgi:hypothetical protein
MNTKLLEQFKKGEVILYTPTFEDFKALMEWCDTQNIKWCDGDKATHNMSILFEANKNNTQGIKNNIDEIVFISSSCIKFNKVTFLAKDLEPDKQTFTKDDLKSGMVVEYKDGDRRLIAGDLVIGEITYALLSDGYNDDLTSKHADYLNIIKVYNPQPGSLKEVLYTKDNLIWEREKEFDWSKVEIDTKILVSEDNKKWEKRHYHCFSDGIVYSYEAGRSSYTTEGISNGWKYAKLYKKRQS